MRLLGQYVADDGGWTHMSGWDMSWMIGFWLLALALAGLLAWVMACRPRATTEPEPDAILAGR